MNGMRCCGRNFASRWVLISVLLILTACTGMTVTPSTIEDGMLLSTPALGGAGCESCAEATLAVALTQARNNVDQQAAATAEIAQADAQVTLNSANATLNAAQTQDQNDANAIAAQLAGTAEIVRANAQATLNSAGSTQVAALTQSQYELQVTQAAGTQAVEAMLTQTSIANNIATQTQIAAATSEWYADKAREREEQRQGPIAFLWMWCLPIFIVLFAGLVLWGFWRWLKIQQANQRILENPEVSHRHDDSLPYLENDIVDSHYQLARPDDQVDQWLDEVKNKLLSNDGRNEDDNSDN